MRRTEQAQGLRLMKFEEVYGHTVRGELSQAEAAEILGTSERTFRRWRDRFEAEGAEGLYDRRLGRLSARRAPVDEVARVLALAGIGGIEEANRFLKEVYLPQHNARFQVTPEADGSAFVPFAGALDDILCIQEERTVSNDNTVRYKRRLLQLPADRHRRHYVKATVRVHEYPDGTLAVFHGPRCLARYRATGEPIDTPTRQAA